MADELDLEQGDPKFFQRVTAAGKERTAQARAAKTPPSRASTAAKQAADKAEDGWLKTGDLLSSQPGGRLYFFGRVGARDLIKPGGLNVYPSEVEQVLLRHPRVKAALVFGTPDPTWREKVVAVVATEDNPAGLEAELMSYVDQNLA